MGYTITWDEVEKICQKMCISISDFDKHFSRLTNNGGFMAGYSGILENIINWMWLSYEEICCQMEWYLHLATTGYSGF